MAKDRRSHCPLDHHSILEEIKQMFTDGCTYDEIETHFSEQGLAISKSTIKRYKKTLKKCKTGVRWQ